VHAEACEATSTVSAAAVNVLLRSIAYRCRSHAPRILKKRLRATLDDGRCGRSTSLFDVTIESVDDPAEILFTTRALDYHPLTQAARNGFCVMPGVALEDPDSDNFHRGFLSIEITSGASPGDHLSLLTPAQQDARFVRDLGPDATLQPALSRILERECALGEEPIASLQTLCGLPLLVQAQTARILRYYGDRLCFRGEQIATVTTKVASSSTPTATGAALAAAAGRRLSVNSICHTAMRFDFFAESKFIPFDVAEFLMRSVTFENLHAKLKPGPRTVTVRLTAGTSVTTETISVHVHAPLVHPGLKPDPVTVDEPTKPKAVLPHAFATIPDAESLQHQGSFHATIMEAAMPGDELLFDSIGVVKVKEKSVYIGKDLVGVVQVPRPNLHDLYLIFAKVTSDHLMNLVRSLSFVNRGTGVVVAGRRVVRVVCVGAEAALGATIDAVVEVASSNGGSGKISVPPVVTLARPLRTITQELSTLCRPLEDSAFAPADGKAAFPMGTVMTVSLMHPPLVAAEYLVLQPCGGHTVKEEEKEGACALRLTHDAIAIERGGTVVARAPLRGYARGDGGIVVGSSVSLTIVGPCSPNGRLSTTRACCAPASPRSSSVSTPRRHSAPVILPPSPALASSAPERKQLPPPLNIHVCERKCSVPLTCEDTAPLFHLTSPSPT
jgi:hypothetical protein